MKDLFSHLKNDLPASIVVFFVAVPLCLGIAMASEAPLFSGIIAGIIGGIVVGAFSGSQLGVSGPAAGLAVIVIDAVVKLGTWEAFLLAVVLAGVLQVIMGFLKLGIIGYYFPTTVIKGMLAGIGLVIILKQIPHALGNYLQFDKDLTYGDTGQKTTFAEFGEMFSNISTSAVVTTISCMAILMLWDVVLSKKHKIFGIIQGPLVAVLVGILLNLGFQFYDAKELMFTPSQLVSIPVAASVNDFIGQFSWPDFRLETLTNTNIYITAFVIAIVASLESLLSVEATDKLDPQKRKTPRNQELKAQGIGNILSGMVGGLPVTQVIVRSSANITFGAKTKLSAIIHGFLILICVILIPNVLNLIPLSALAAILFMVGYKLAKPALFKKMYSYGWNQFIPFIATIIGILATDLLKGIGIGMVIGIYYILKNSLKNAARKEKTEGGHRIILAEEVTFLNKGSILKQLEETPEHSTLIIDGTASKFIDFDVLELIKDFQINSKEKNIKLELVNIKLS